MILDCLNKERIDLPELDATTDTGKTLVSEKTEMKTEQKAPQY